VGKEEIHVEFNTENLIEREYLRGVVVDERMIFQ
jgi:hypothetical protein